MASKYLQKYPVPPDFYQILNDFGKEVLRSQPEDIIEFAVNYFDFKVENPDKPFPQNPENMKYNIAQKQKPQQYEKTPYDQLQGKYDGNNRNAPSVGSESQNQQEQEQLQQQYEQEEEQQQMSEQNQQASEDRRELSGSRQSGRSQKSAQTHPEEKQITKEFMGDLYSSAVQQTVEQGGQQSDRQNQSQNDQNVSNNSNNLNNTTHPEEKEEAKNYTKDVYNQALNEVNEGEEIQAAGGENQEVQLDGPIEEYENAALLIQKNFRSKKAK